MFCRVHSCYECVRRFHQNAKVKETRFIFGRLCYVHRSVSPQFTHSTNWSSSITSFMWLLCTKVKSLSHLTVYRSVQALCISVSCDLRSAYCHSQQRIYRSCDGAWTLLMCVGVTTDSDRVRCECRVVSCHPAEKYPIPSQPIRECSITSITPRYITSCMGVSSVPFHPIPSHTWVSHPIDPIPFHHILYGSVECPILSHPIRECSIPSITSHYITSRTGVSSVPSYPIPSDYMKRNIEKSRWEWEATALWGSFG